MSARRGPNRPSPEVHTRGTARPARAPINMTRKAGRCNKSEPAAIPAKTSRRMNTKRCQIMCKQRGR